ncbi:MAG: arginine--tRNA ligase [Microbacteriaceae bacterium]|nr:arginine--tRNA ligase [Microbacteriaceae bacterium]
MTPSELSQILLEKTQQWLTENGHTEIQLEEIALERPKSRDHGDWATTIALKIAGSIGTNPRDLGGKLAELFSGIPGVEEASVAGPGFINIRLDASNLGAVAKQIVDAGSDYGTLQINSSKRINVEYVSANPTGPMHIGHARWAALGDSIARVLEASGADVTTEFYINDAGKQMDLFGESILAATLGEDAPEGGYKGEYVTDLANRIKNAGTDLAALPREEAIIAARESGYALQLGDLQKVLGDFRARFDVWFSERTLHAKDASGNSKISEAVETLREQGHVFEEDGATWVRTTDFGDDKDRVITRGNGIYTYFAADAAYYLDKKARGYSEKIYLLGADHHGYVHRLKAIAGAAGDDPNTDLSCIVGQLVTLRGSRLSKRAGNIVEMKDAIDDIGVDSLRYWLARYPADSPIDLDADTLTSNSNENPVFYVQYAHARTNAVARKAQESGIDGSLFSPETLNHETENALLGELQQYPLIVEIAAKWREPHRIARYLEQLAGAYHRWYDATRVVPSSAEPIESVHHSRLVLNSAAGQVLKNGLNLLGVSAPEKM